MKKLTKVLLLLIMTLMPFNNIATNATSYLTATDYDLDAWSFIMTDASGKPQTPYRYFTNKKGEINITEEIEKYENAVKESMGYTSTEEVYTGRLSFREVEFGLFEASNTNNQVEYLGATKGSSLNLELGSPEKYDATMVYELRYRMNFLHLMGEDIQPLKTDWIAYEGGTYFKPTIPNSKSPAEKLNETISWVDTSNQFTIVKRDNSDLSFDNHTLVLTDSNTVEFNYKSDVWFEEKMVRKITQTHNGKKKAYSNEPFTANKKSLFKQIRKEIISLENNIEKFEYDISLSKNSGDVVNDTKSTTYVIRDIFSNVFDIKVNEVETGYRIKVSLSENYTAQQTMLNNSEELFGLDLTKFYMVVTPDKDTTITDYDKEPAGTNMYENQRRLVSLNEEVEIRTQSEDLTLRLGYIDNYGNDYTYSVPLKGNITTEFTNIKESGIVRTFGEKFIPTLNIKQLNQIYKYPATDDFNWYEFENQGTKVQMVVYKKDHTSDKPDDLNDFFAVNCGLNFECNTSYEIYETTSKTTDEISSIELTEDGEYIIGVQITNNLGEEYTEFKEFILVANDNIEYLPVHNNRNIYIDGQFVRTDDSLTAHLLTLAEDGQIKQKSAYNYLTGKLLLTNVKAPADLKLFDKELKHITPASLNTIKANLQQVTKVVEYDKGFLITGKSTTGRPVWYFNAQDETATQFANINLPSIITDITIKNNTIYILTDNSLIAYKISEDNNFEVEELHMITVEDVFEAGSSFSKMDFTETHIAVTKENSSEISLIRLY